MRPGMFRDVMHSLFDYDHTIGRYCPFQDSVTKEVVLEKIKRIRAFPVFKELSDKQLADVTNPISLAFF